MALKKFNHLDMQEILEFQNAGFEKIAADKTPSANNEGNEYVAPSTTQTAAGGANRKKIVLNGVVEEFAFLTDTERRSRMVGTVDATPGDLSAASFDVDPAEGAADTLATMDRGDKLLVTVAGDLPTVGTTALGAPQPETRAEIGDMLVATVDAPATIDDFLIMQTNIDLSNLAEPYFETLTAAGAGPWTATLDAAALVSLPGKTNLASYRLAVDGQEVYVEGAVTEDANGATQVVFSFDFDVSASALTCSGMAWSA